VSPVASLETTFLIDLLNDLPAAIQVAKALEARGEPRCVTAPAAAEVLVGAHLQGGRSLEKTKELLDSLVLLDFDREAYVEAGRLGAILIQRGEEVSTPDLMIAAISKRHGQRLITRDRAFSRIPGLSIEMY
jgi:predicted nucleic acid-binding protein